MDMSVPVTPKSGSQVASNPKAGIGHNHSDLDVWMQKVDALGELKTISAEVDPDLETATISYLVGSEKSPALLFDNVKGHPGHRVLYNIDRKSTRLNSSH